MMTKYGIRYQMAIFFTSSILRPRIEMTGGVNGERCQEIFVKDSAASNDTLFRSLARSVILVQGYYHDPLWDKVPDGLVHT